jgi:16S rRNA processing protein RimM
VSTLIPIARIVSAHGIKGHVKLKSYASDVKTLTACGPLQTADGRALEITKLKPADDLLIADIKTVRDRNAAEELAGHDLFIARARLPTLATGEYYLADLIGKPVHHESASLGVVTSIENYGAGDLMELGNGALIPVAFITSFTDVISVDLPPGFLDPASHEDRHH